MSTMAVGLDATQSPPPPMISGPIVALLSAVILLISAPRFGRPAPREEGDP
jgi:hypothetical protein